MSNSQLTPKQQDLLLHMDAYKSMGPHGIHLRILKVLLSLQNLSMIFEQFWESEGFQLTGSWQMSQFSTLRRRTLETTGLSVSLQCQAKSWKRLLWEVLKNTWRTVQASVTASTVSHRESPAC